MTIDTTPAGNDAPDTAESLAHAHERVAHYRSVLRRAGQEIERRLARLDDLAAAAAQASEPGGVLGEALRAALGMLDAQCGAILVIEDERQPPALGARYALDEPLAALLTGRAFQHAAILLPPILGGQTLLLSGTDTRTQSLPLRGVLDAYGLAWLVSLPLRSGGKLLGALLLCGEQPAVITVQDTHWLALIGQQAALALEAVRLRKHMWSLAEAVFSAEHDTLEPSARPSGEQPEDLEALLEAMMAAEEEVQRFNQDLTALNHLAELLGQSLAPATVLDAAVRQAQEILGVPKAWIYLLESDPPHLSLQAHAGLTARYLASRGRLSATQGLEGQALEGADLLVVNDWSARAGTMPLVIETEGLRAAILAPLRARDRALGVLIVAREARHAWTVREQRLVRAIAGQAALALHNALLYEQVRDASQAQEMGNRVLQDLNRHLLDSQAAQHLQMETLTTEQKAHETLLAQHAALREQLATLLAHVRALVSPELGALNLAQQAQITEIVRALAALSDQLKT
jgi:GAF domain-containing protein